MIPLYIDINPNCDASTTINKEKIEYCIPAIGTQFDKDKLDLKSINLDFVSVFTNLNLKKSNDVESAEEDSNLSDNFEVLAKFKFKNSKVIKAKIKRTVFTPTVIVN